MTPTVRPTLALSGMPTPPPACVAPSVTATPASVTVTAPASASMTAAGSTPPGCSAPTVQWQMSSDGGATFTSVPRGTSPTLTILPTSISMSGYQYRAVFTDSAGSIASSPATVTVDATRFPSQQGQLFASDSPWNQPLPANAPVDPTSPARVAALVDGFQQSGHAPWINTSSYSVPVYRVPADQPTARVTLDDAAVPALQQAWAAVPIPESAAPAPGTDAHLVIYQPSTDKMWEFWRLSKQPDGFHADWGGAMANVSSNAGYYSSAAWPGLSQWEGGDWGSTASSLPAIAGLMTIDELQAGHIDHALAVATTTACTWFVWPARRTDGDSSDPNCLPEGAHLRLDPRLDLTTLNLPPIALIMARAMQKYGIIVRDTSWSSFNFYAEQPQGADPYNGPNGIFAGWNIWDFLPTIPWNHLQLLQMGTHCTSSRCS
jgi:hypothetical protein